MLNFSAPGLVAGWQLAINTLAFDYSEALTWGLAAGYREPIHLHFDNVLDDQDMQLNMAGFTTARWTRLMNLYFRYDLEGWIKESAQVLTKYHKRPIVRGYQPNRNTEHSHGSCLQAVNLRLFPQPGISIISRACLIDRTGLIDLAVMNTIARYFRSEYAEIDHNLYDIPITGDWIIHCPYINSYTQAFHLIRFGLINRDFSNQKAVLDKHIIGQRVAAVYARLPDYEDIKFGPMKRSAKRIIAWVNTGEIHRNKLIRELSLDVIKEGGLGDSRDSEETDQ
jgi:hypothetical protein